MSSSVIHFSSDRFSFLYLYQYGTRLFASYLGKLHSNLDETQRLKAEIDKESSEALYRRQSMVTIATCLIRSRKFPHNVGKG
jgi:hypothetical protein